MSRANFTANLKRFTDKTELELDRVVRKIAFDVDRRVTKKTPVDTGRARANWNVSVGEIDTSIQLDTFSKKVTNLGRGDGENPIYITNSLPYIFSLEHGGSRQAPSGMVEVTMAEIKGHIQNVIRG